MNKERVIVFDGEDKFIAPRKVAHTAKKIKSNSNAPLSKEGEIFKAFMRKQGTPVVIPSPSEADFCKRMEAFIKTNGDGRATPEMVMKAVQLFQENCIEKPKQDKAEVAETGEMTPRETPTDVPVETPPALDFPNWEIFECDALDREIANLEQTLTTSRFTPEIRAQYEAAIAAAKAVRDTKCLRNPPALPDVPPTPTGGTLPPTVVLPPSGVSLSTPTLGKPPMGGSISNGGAKDEPKKGSNWLIWALLAGAALYLLTRKKD